MPDLARTDTESLLRQTLTRLNNAASYLDHRWQHAGPIEQGDMWKALRDAHMEARRVLATTQDPKPGQCAHTWFDVLDNVWDRCGLPPSHRGEHKAEYMVKAEKEATVS